MLRMLVTLLATALPMAAMAAAPVRPAAVIPFTLVGDHIVVDAVVAGRPGRFILDTGSGSASVTPGFARGLDLQVHGGPVQASGAGEGATEIRIGAARAVNIGPLHFENMPVMVFSADPFKPLGQPMSGALGYDVFARWTVTVDFAARRLFFIDPRSYTPPPAAIVLPADLTARVPIVSVTVRARSSSRPRRARLVVDTGTSTFAVLFSSDFAGRAHIATISPRRTLGLGSGSAGLSIGSVMRVHAIDAGGLVLNSPVVGVPGDTTGFFASGVANGTMGQGLFRRGRLTIDYPHKRIVFEPGPNVDDDWDYPDRCGWSLGKDSAGHWTVLFVGRDTPAQDAGVQKADRLVQLDGKPVAAMDREALRNACMGEGDLALTLRRGAETVSPVLHKRKLI